MKSLKHLITNSLFFFVTLTVVAQKLPNKQTISLRAIDTNVDGKTTGKFQAYNTALQVNYTISNDDDNLYLTVRSGLHDISDKILRGGVTLTINHTVSKRDIEHVIVTYPVLQGVEESDLTNMYARKENQRREANSKDIVVDDINKMLNTESKNIKISGIKDITDETISVYNQDGIKAVSQFDKELMYTYELAIPLKYLNLPNNGADAFSYNIKINGLAESSAPNHSGPPPPPMMTTNTAPTDCRGEYTLAKKP